MRTRLSLAFIAAAGAAFVACGDDEKVESNDITGTWYATSVEYVSRTGLGTVDVIADGGTATLVLDEDNTLHYTCTLADETPMSFDGTWELTGDIGDLMRVHPGEAEWYFAFEVSLSGNHLSLTGGGGEYDFDDDGDMDQAEWNLTLAREAPPSAYPSLFPRGPAVH